MRGEVEIFLKLFIEFAIKEPEDIDKLIGKTNDNIDGPALDAIIFAVSKLRELLQSDIESLKLPNALKVSIKLLKSFIEFIHQSKLLKHSRMARVKGTPVRSVRPSRRAAQTSQAITNALIGSKRNIGPALGRPIPAGGVEVKRMRTARKRDIKIKKLIAQPRQVSVKKNGQVVRRMTVRRKAYFPGRRRKTY